MNVRLVARGAQGEVLWEAPQWAQAVELLVPFILTIRLCAQTVFLARKGKMKSASEKDFRNFNETSPDSEGNR